MKWAPYYLMKSLPKLSNLTLQLVMSTIFAETKIQAVLTRLRKEVSAKPLLAKSGYGNKPIFIGKTLSEKYMRSLLSLESQDGKGGHEESKKRGTGV